jgi:SAM-dependent methyltransferase
MKPTLKSHACRSIAATLIAGGLGCSATAARDEPAPQVEMAPAPAQTATTRRPDVIWVPSEDDVVTAMLTMAKVTKDDVVYDLGCGDGKIVIAAARQFGARGVGVEIDPTLVEKARAAVKAAGVEDRVTIVQGDIFDPGLQISNATVVALFLLENMNAKLRPRLQKELKPGSRVVSNSFHMGAAWPAERVEEVGNSTIYFWTIRESVLAPAVE